MMDVIKNVNSYYIFTLKDVIYFLEMVLETRKSKNVLL
jgi:hypothetical protein